ncbi:MAG: hypothetical protein ACRDRZ_02245 [Pseudonocardiaceae bacterium]
MAPDTGGGEHVRAHRRPGLLARAAVLVAVTGAVLLRGIAVAAVWLWLWRPDLVESTLSSPRAITFIVIAVGVAAGSGC